MKKLLILTLVLGMSGIATAALDSIELAIDGTKIGATAELLPWTVNLQIYSNNTNTGLAYLDLPLASKGIDYSVDPAYVTANAGDMGGVIEYEWSPYYEYELTVAKSPSGTVTAGVMLNIPITRLRWVQTITVELYDASLNLVDSATLTLIPEPMTIALLGLGGLLLRRRR